MAIKPTKDKKKNDEVVSSKLLKARKRVIDVAEEFQHLKILAYGANGKGKTRLGATAPKPIIIDADHGTMSIRKFPDVKVFKIERWPDIDLAYWYLKKGDHDRETVVLDTVTSLAQLCMKFVLGDEASRDPTKDPDMPSKREWGKVGELMRTIILNFRELPMHVVYLAQERRGYAEEDEEAPEVYPEVSPSVRTTLTAAVDIIGRQYVREVVVKGGEGKKVAQPSFRMLIGPSERYVTKDRSEAGLPKVIRDPNITSILKKIKGGK